MAWPRQLLILSVSGAGFPYEKVVQRVLYLQVLDYDRFSRNDPIGEVSIPLNKVDLTQMQTFWKDLKPCSDGSVRPWSPSRPPGTVLEGRLPLSLRCPNRATPFLPQHFQPREKVQHPTEKFLFPNLYVKARSSLKRVSHLGLKRPVSGRSKMKVFFFSCLPQDQKASHWGWPRFLLPRFPLQPQSPPPRDSSEGSQPSSSLPWWDRGALGAPSGLGAGCRGEGLLVWGAPT